MMYVGASTNHLGDTFRVFDPVTKRVHHSRNVTFRKKTFYRQDMTGSTDQPHPLDNTFEDLPIIYLLSDVSFPVSPPPVLPPVLQPDDDLAMPPLKRPNHNFSVASSALHILPMSLKQLVLTPMMRVSFSRIGVLNRRHCLLLFLRV